MIEYNQKRRHDMVAILMIIGMVAQAIIFVGILYCFMWVGTLLFHWFRLMLYWWFGVDWLTNDEKIEFGVIEQNHTEAEVIDYDPSIHTHEEFWDNLNNHYDVQFKQDQTNPDEVSFQGRVKRRR